MATKHGHGYVSNYRGGDASAAEQFNKLTDLSRELETSYGYLYIGADTAALGIAVGLKVPFGASYLTSTAGAPQGSRDTLADVANSRILVRYGGMYRATFQGYFTYGFGFLNPIAWWIAVNGTPAGFAWSHPASPVGFTSLASFTIPILVPDGGYVEVFVQCTGGGNTMIFHAGNSLLLQGNRL